jgi:hypothetical protein
MNLFEKINKLPHELVDIIYDFIPGLTKCVLNKSLYRKYHSCIKPFISSRGLFDNYIRDIIRKDLDFVFFHIAKENYTLWLKAKKCTYKNKIFSNYMELLENLCIETESTKCRNIMNEAPNKSGLHKNQHKNNIVKSIDREWIN